MTRVLLVSGSARPDGNLAVLMDIVADAVAASSGQVRRLNLHETRLPVMIWGDPDQQALPEVALVRESAAWADALILGTPEYHGSLSGALKNWFDYLYPELAGKLVGVVATTGGGTGDMSVTAVRNSVMWCHGFCLPFHVAATEADFQNGTLASVPVAERAVRIGHDMVRYAGPIRAAFAQGQSLGPQDPRAGFAGLHTR